MNANQKIVLYNLLGLLFLCIVSAYRQFSLRFLPADRFRELIVLAAYLILLGVWCFAIHSRITQKSMRIFLYAEIAVMTGWVTLRYFQDAVFYKNMHLMRQTGFLIVVPMVLIPTFGLYSAFCLGRSEDYRIPHRLYYLLIPDLVLTLLMITNSYHHIMVRTRKNEPENLSFHANYGVSVIIVWAVSLILVRLIIVYRKSRSIRARRLHKLLPFLIGGLMPVIVIPYLINSFAPIPELIEMTVKLFFVEAMTWESCILLGMVPVNTQYRKVFESSTVGMQIFSEEGNLLAASGHACTLSQTGLQRLRESHALLIPPGTELHLHKLHNGFLVYQQDVSALHAVIADLQKTAQELEKESDLLSEELKTRSEEARIEAQNHIYDSITNEVGSQLVRIRSLTESAMQDESSTAFPQIIFLGTYIKRRCNLRLTEQETGTIPAADLELSVRDLLSCFRMLGTDADAAWMQTADCSPELSLCVFDLLEHCAEAADFALKTCRISVTPEQKFCIRCDAADPGAAEAIADADFSRSESIAITAQTDGNTVHLTVQERKEISDAEAAHP